MSNRATIQPTIFVNYGTDDKTYGVRIYDNYDQSYDNTWDSIPDDDLEILQKVIDNENEVFVSIINYFLENESGVFIGDTWYDWDDIKHLFER